MDQADATPALPTTTQRPGRRLVHRFGIAHDSLLGLPVVATLAGPGYPIQRRLPRGLHRRLRPARDISWLRMHDERRLNLALHARRAAAEYYCVNAWLRRKKLLELAGRDAVCGSEPSAEMGGIDEAPAASGQRNRPRAQLRAFEFELGPGQSLLQDPLRDANVRGAAQRVKVPERDVVGSSDPDRCQIKLGQVLANVGQDEY
jgi:hypothetical protein